MRSWGVCMCCTTATAQKLQKSREQCYLETEDLVWSCLMPGVNFWFHPKLNIKWRVAVKPLLVDDLFRGYPLAFLKQRGLSKSMNSKIQEKHRSTNQCTIYQCDLSNNTTGILFEVKPFTILPTRIDLDPNIAKFWWKYLSSNLPTYERKGRHVW